MCNIMQPNENTSSSFPYFMSGSFTSTSGAIKSIVPGAIDIGESRLGSSSLSTFSRSTITLSSIPGEELAVAHLSAFQYFLLLILFAALAAALWTSLEIIFWVVAMAQ